MKTDSRGHYFQVIKIFRSREVDEIRIFRSLFAMRVKPSPACLKAAQIGESSSHLAANRMNGARRLVEGDLSEVFVISSKNRDLRLRGADVPVGGEERTPKTRLPASASNLKAAHRIGAIEGPCRMREPDEFSEGVSFELPIGNRTQNLTCH